MSSLISLSNLRITFDTPRGQLAAVRGVDLEVLAGESLGVVGESGSGKTVLSRASMGLLTMSTAHRTGTGVFDGQDLSTASREAVRDTWGTGMAMIFQDPMTALNPVRRIGSQLSEGLRVRLGMSRKEAKKRSIELLQLVRIPDPEKALRKFPNQLSGGMRQRVMIACALATSPKLLIADEPTTGLDVTVQSQIMDLLKEIRSAMGTAIILISHDLALIDDVCDKVVVMHAGATVEVGSVKDLEKPLHPYTVALNSSRIDVAAPGSELVTILGSAPSVGQWQSGCRFSLRCNLVQPDCNVGEHPALIGARGAHQTACLHSDRLIGEGAR